MRGISAEKNTILKEEIDPGTIQGGAGGAWSRRSEWH